VIQELSAMFESQVPWVFVFRGDSARFVWWDHKLQKDVNNKTVKKRKKTNGIVNLRLTEKGKDALSKLDVR